MFRERGQGRKPTPLVEPFQAAATANRGGYYLQRSWVQCPPQEIALCAKFRYTQTRVSECLVSHSTRTSAGCHGTSGIRQEHPVELSCTPTRDEGRNLPDVCHQPDCE